VGLAAGPALAAKPTFSLATEMLTGSGTNVTLSCSGTTLSFSASGTATGPYPGTFTESGTAEVAAAALVGSPLGSFAASFTIFDTSGKAVATGTKTLNTGSGSCNPPSPGIDAVHALTNYSASHKHRTDTGLAQVEIGPGTFAEQFGVSGP
jgi:hypothetical protein